MMSFSLNRDKVKITISYMGGKYGHSCAGATHMTKVFVKRTILFLQCNNNAVAHRNGGAPHIW